ncbi:TetR/AcrR family transcriptional regulator [Chitinophagaceae bacterium LWZ2-11]
MGIAERKMRQKEVVRVAILEAAWHIVLREGWQSLSIRKIADSIEYSIPVIYTHFENKDAIVLEFIKQGFDMLAKQLQEAKAQHQSPQEQLKAIADIYWEFAFSHQAYYEVMFGLGIPSCETVNQVAAMRAVTGILISAVEQTIAAGKNPTVNTHLKFHTFWSILHGFVSIQMLSHEEQPGMDKKIILDDAVESFIKGITA